MKDSGRRNEKNTRLLKTAKALMKDLEQDFAYTAHEMQSAYELRKAIAKVDRENKKKEH